MVSPGARRASVTLRTAVGGVYFVLTLTCLSVVGAMVLLFAHRSAEAFDRERAGNRVRYVGMVLSALTREARVEAVDLLTVRQALRGEMQAGERCLLIDEGGHLLFDSGGSGSPGRILASVGASSSAALVRGEWIGVSSVGSAGESCVLLTPSPALEGYGPRVVLPLIAFLALLVGVVSVAGFRLAGAAGAPLETIAGAAAEVASGESPPLLPRSRIWEVDRLSAALNDMVATISSQRQELLRRYVQVESNNIMLERAYRDIKGKTELLEQHQRELLLRNQDVAARNQEIRDQNHRLGSLNIELARSNHQLNLVIGELKRKDDALGRLRESEAAQAAAIVEGTGDLVVVMGNQGHLTLANPAALQFLGRSAEELRGLHCSAVLACRGLAGEKLCDSKETCPLARTRESCGDYYQEIVLFMQGGRASDMGARWFVVRDRVTGSPERAVCILRDMTRQKQVERAKSDFVSAVSHELRTPLTSMRGFTYLLLRDDVHLDRSEEREYLQMMDDEIGRLARLIDGILNVSRIEAGLPLELKSSAVRLDALVGRVLARLEAICAGSILEVSVAEGLTALADEDKLFQVLTNLVSNAVKFSPPGTQIRIAAHVEGDIVRVSVADNGMGIPQGDLDKVFERFYRGDEVRGRIGGSGLGLHIARALVEAHGGRIWAESEGIGKGSRFVFELPLVPAQPVAQANQLGRRAG